MVKRAEVVRHDSVLTTAMAATLAAFDKMPTIITCDQFQVHRKILDGGKDYIRKLRDLSHFEKRNIRGMERYVSERTFLGDVSSGGERSWGGRTRLNRFSLSACAWRSNPSAFHTGSSIFPLFLFKFPKLVIGVSHEGYRWLRPEFARPMIGTMHPGIKVAAFNFRGQCKARYDVHNCLVTVQDFHNRRSFRG